MEKTLKQQPANCIKVVLFGPESTGKTTLSKQLARYYNSVWVPEYAREYLQDKWNNERKTCESSDLLPIAIGQMELENELAQKTNSVLICDTDLLETKVYSEEYYSGICDPILEKYALENTYDLYFLTYIDTPWETDDLRDKPDERLEMFKAFEAALIKHKRPYILLKGDRQKRLKTAVKHINNLFKKSQVNFTGKDIQQIEALGLTVDKVNRQINIFKKGLPFITIKSAATIGEGILKFSSEKCKDYINYFNNKRDENEFVKFVPASGAATRMFKFLFDFLEDFKPDEETIDDYVNRKKASNLSVFFNERKNFPFYNSIKKQLFDDYKNFDDLTISNQLVLFVKSMLDEGKLNYGNSPKGLFPFHQYKDRIASAFEEHLFEGACYASANNQAELHFTISEMHNQKFEDEYQRIRENVERKTNTKFNVTYSYQKHSTDTIAVTSENKPFREPNGSLLFRPSGHGALLENLNDLDADIIFIKNIDNVVVSNYIEEIGNSKMTLAGVLLEVQEQAFKYQEVLANEKLSKETITEIAEFLSNKLNVVISEDFEKYSTENQIEYLKENINKPIRICGMVKNEGEPGGGPFWVEDENGVVSLQIVESAQVDTNIKKQKELFSDSTHFNPVDLVCGVKNYKGEKYDLTKFVDPNAAFITMKTKAGKKLKALELPGLWNGSMALWNTIFVEVPLITFNPVKTVNDLLKDAHQIS